MSMDSVSDHLPLNPRVFAILLSLSEGEAHGYAIKRSVEEGSMGSIRLDPGSLYRSIARMVDDGWIEESDERPDSDSDDARRRYYALSPLGRAILSAEAARLAHMLDTARALKIV